MHNLFLLPGKKVRTSTFYLDWVAYQLSYPFKKRVMLIGADVITVMESQEVGPVAMTVIEWRRVRIVAMKALLGSGAIWAVTM